MKVRELIEALSQQDPEAEAVVRGYEGGVDSVEKLTVRYCVRDANTEDFYGAHEPVFGVKSMAAARRAVFSDERKRLFKAVKLEDNRD